MAAEANPAIAEALLDHLDEVEVRYALGQTDTMVDALAKHPDKLNALPPSSRLELLSSVCDAAHRDVALSLAAGSKLDDALQNILTKRIEGCLADKRRLEPAFRKWLGH